MPERPQVHCMQFSASTARRIGGGNTLRSRQEIFDLERRGWLENRNVFISCQTKKHSTRDRLHGTSAWFSIPLTLGICCLLNQVGYINDPSETHYTMTSNFPLPRPLRRSWSLAPARTMRIVVLGQSAVGKTGRLRLILFC